MGSKDITGFVLAGGQSRRMGKDKARIAWEAGTLLTHAVATLEKVASCVFIVGAVEGGNLPVAVLPDKYPGRGPLAGVHAALARTTTDWNLFLAVDLPLVTSDLLSFIAGECADNHAVAVVPRTGGRLQPLCASYHRALLPDIQTAIQNSELSIHRLLERPNPGIMGENSSIRIVNEDEIVAHGFRPEMLINVNTLEDLEQVRRIASKLHV